MDLPLVDDRPQPAVLTAGDLRRGRECEFGLLVDLDVRLGRREALPVEVDPVRERFGDLGRDYEQEVTDELTAATGDGVVDAGRLSPEQLLPLLRDPSVRLVHQAPVAGERFRGRADHLLRHDDETWVVAETKLARSARPHALLQVAAYAEALAEAGVAVAPFVRLFLGDDSVVDTPREDLAQDLAAVRSHLERLQVTGAPPASDEVVRIPVVYDGEDLADVAELLGVDTEEVVRRHGAEEWAVAFAGYAPGFGYCAGTRFDWDVPRRSEPRTAVPAGSVALAGEFTGVYPRKGPGGWQLIGRTAEQMFDPHREPAALLRPGVRVAFEAVDA